MIGFWISAGAMVLMVSLLLLQALRNGGRQPVGKAGSEDLAVYRDQLKEITRDLSRGTIQPEEAARLRVEVQRRMLDADRTAAKTSNLTTGISFATSAVMVLLALGAAFAGYQWLGQPGYPDLPLQDRLAAADALYQNRPSQAEAEAAAPVQTVEADPAMLDLMVKLRAAMVPRPNDLQGHILLAKNEAALGNYIAARAAQEAVLRIRGDQITGDDLAQLAQTMIYAAGGVITPETEQVLIRCLTLDPRNGLARFYSGLMFAQVTRPDRTFRLWQPLLAESPPDAEWTAPIRALLPDVAAAAGINYTLPPLTKGPDAADIAAASQMSGADRAEMIRGMVGTLETRLTTQGGPVEDWAKLITSLGVLGEAARAQSAYDAAKLAFTGQPGTLSALQAAAVQAGLAP